MHAGAILRATRESYGASIEAVAAQLKLAPRQVQALEEGEFDLLPGRTFVRGFMRNYARLLELDPEVILQALPRGGASALEAPPLSSTTGTIGELPDSNATRPAWLRWLDRTRGGDRRGRRRGVRVRSALARLPPRDGRQEHRDPRRHGCTCTRRRRCAFRANATQARPPAVQPNVAPL